MLTTIKCGATRWLFFGIYAATAVVIYSQRGWANANEILRISVGEYALVFIMALIIWLIMRGVAWGQSLRQKRVRI
ncbi:MAG: hypothetical protein GY943_04140 [Chloroflexi bacterium]|nr:hypothetical protein [Chloroflexota bacterium]